MWLKILRNLLIVASSVIIIYFLIHHVFWTLLAFGVFMGWMFYLMKMGDDEVEQLTGRREE